MTNVGLIGPGAHFSGFGDEPPARRAAQSTLTSRAATIRYLRQAPILIPLLIIAGVFGAAQHERVIAEWRAMYPSDPREKAALQFCFAENHQFNRMSDRARKDCYGTWLPRLPDKLADLGL